MKKIMFLFSVIILLFAGVIGYQNRDFFLSTQSIMMDFIFFKYQSPGLPIGLFFIVIFLGGVLAASFFSLMSKYKAITTIKNLSSVNISQGKKITELKKEIVGLAKPFDTETQQG